MSGPTFEASVVKVDRSYRLILPPTLSQPVGWILGDKPIAAWLLMGSPGRCRLLSAIEVENDEVLQSLRSRIAAELEAVSTALEFRNEELIALAYRLVPVRIAPPEPGRRLTLPKVTAAIMQIQPGKSEIALLLLHGHIELWTMDTLRAAASTPLEEII